MKTLSKESSAVIDRSIYNLIVDLSKEGDLLSRNIVNLSETNNILLITSPNKSAPRPNIWSIRNSHQEAGEFDDVTIVFTMDRDYKIMDLIIGRSTVDPSDHYLLNPINPKGTAILVEGTHYKMFKLGTHKGYEALVQNRPVKVIRDYNKDTKLDFTSDNTDIGMFGINFHRASKWKILRKIGLYGAGCTVIQDPVVYDKMINFIKSSVPYNGDKFNYTLININKFTHGMIGTKAYTNYVNQIYKLIV